MDFAGDRSARADRGRPLASRFASPTWRRSRTSTSSSGLGADVNVFGAEGAADVVGGGPTGVETARAVAEIYRAEPAKDYPEISQEETRVTLVEAGPGLFSMFKLKLREYATKALTARTVDVRTGAMVATVSPNRVKLKSGEELKAQTLVWGAGLQGIPSCSRSDSSSSGAIAAVGRI